MKLVLIACTLLGATTILLMSQSATSNPPVVTGDAKVDKLLSQMTLEEKITLIHDGPEAQPSGIGGAGTWSREDARKNGIVIARDAKALGQDVVQVGPVPALEKIAGRKVAYAIANDFDRAPIPASALSSNGKPGLLRTNTTTNQTQTNLERHSNGSERWRVYACLPVSRLRRVGDIGRQQDTKRRWRLGEPPPLLQHQERVVLVRQFQLANSD